MRGASTKPQQKRLKSCLKELDPRNLRGSHCKSPGLLDWLPAGTDYGSKMEGYGKDLADKSNSEAHVTAAVTVSVLRVVSGMLALAECQ